MAQALTPISTSSSSFVLAIFLGWGTTAGVPVFLVGAVFLFYPLTPDWGTDGRVPLSFVGTRVLICPVCSPGLDLPVAPD